MTCNVGFIERLVRGLLIAPIMVVLAFAVFDPGSVPGVIALVVAGAALVTAIVSWCPISRALGVNTCDTGGERPA